MGCVAAVKMMVGWGLRRRRKVLVRQISPNFTNAIAKYFGTGPKSIEQSQYAHDSFVAALQKHGLEVKILPGLEEYPDCCFVEDAGVVVNGSLIACNLGHPSRAGEVDSIKEALGESLEIIEMPDGANLDGGDVVFFDGTFIIGLSTRTNQKGVDFLESICHEKGFSTYVLDIPDTTLHLSTICSSPAPGLILTAEGHLTAEQFNGLTAEIIWIPNEESYAANTIGFEGNRIIISDGYPKTRELVEQRGFLVTTVDMEHIRAADGSLTCLKIFYE